jgi:hypothetical protein
MRAFAVLVLMAGCGAGQDSLPGESSNLGFFITSAGLGRGGDLGGVEGADEHCASLANAVGAGHRTWRAYLSTQGDGRVSARDRIGTGPWQNAEDVTVAADVEALHAEDNDIDAETALDEHGKIVNGLGDDPNEHDILTGTRPDGTAVELSDDRTCANWSSKDAGSARIGHHDRLGQGDLPMSWNSAHNTSGCAQEDLEYTGGSGRFYCFAAD